jgi:hypothetical protein
MSMPIDNGLSIQWGAFHTFPLSVRHHLAVDSQPVKLSQQRGSSNEPLGSPRIDRVGEKPVV